MENQTFKTEDGKEVVFKETLNGYDQRAYRKVLINIGEDGVNKAESLEVLENAVIQTTILSFDGSTEDILNRVLLLPAWEYEKIVSLANEIITEFTKKKALKLNGNTKTGSEGTESD